MLSVEGSTPVDGDLTAGMMGCVSVRRCNKCGKRWRGQDGWNVDIIAGLEAGYVCPNCKTSQQDLEAELNRMLGRSDVSGGIRFGPEMSIADVKRLGRVS